MACRSCNADVIWALGPNGKTMPMDAEPDPAGAWELRQIADGLAALFVAPDDRDAGPYYTSHFVTCPFASQHRRSRK